MLYTLITRVYFVIFILFIKKPKKTILYTSEKKIERSGYLKVILAFKTVVKINLFCVNIQWFSNVFGQVTCIIYRSLFSKLFVGQSYSLLKTNGVYKCIKLKCSSVVLL